MKEANVDKYAGSEESSPYDALAKHNREYQRLVAAVPQLFAEYAPNAKLLCDLGCGSGNISLAIYDMLKEKNPEIKIEASDINDKMIDIFNAKISRHGLENVISTEIKDATDRSAYPEAHFDALNSMHVLSWTGKTPEVLQNIQYWLAPGGIMVVTDIGREIVVENWSKGVWGWVVDDMRKEGYKGPLAWIPTVKLFAKYKDAKKENKHYQEGQKTGQYTMHTSDQFKSWVRDAGFEILYFNNEYYRDPVSHIGVDDVVVARKK